MLLRNGEICRGLLAWGAAAAALSVCGWLAFGIPWVWTAAVGGSLALLHLAITRRRYGRLAALSREIDRILHGGGPADLDRFREGELAILQNELQKMTVRLQTQADALRRDKAFLADSLADISHQIRTPLTSLQLIASLLAEAGEPRRRQELVRELNGLLRRMDWLIETLLKLSRLDAGTVELAADEVQVERLIARAAEPLAVAMELREQRLTVQSAGGETLRGDLAWSVEALGNVLKNCMEHNPHGGEIRIHVRQTPIFTELVVSDDGPGLDPEDLPHLFERFYKGKHAAPSSIGIGLALASRILAAQNGTISAGNGRGGGAEFVIRFYARTV